MPRPRGTHGSPIGGRARIDALARSQREAANVDAAVSRLIAHAKRGPEYATVVEAEIARFGAAQLRATIMGLWLELAAYQQHSQHENRS